jgi:hypothetical protein
MATIRFYSAEIQKWMQEYSLSGTISYPFGSVMMITSESCSHSVNGFNTVAFCSSICSATEVLSNKVMEEEKMNLVRLKKC